MDNTLVHILAATEARPTGPEKWLGHCLTHGSKRHRDFSIKRAGARILVHCFAGCLTPAICASLGIEVKDLFTDAIESDPAQRRAAAQRRECERLARERHALQQGMLIDALREADTFVQSRRGINISAWTDERLHDELNALADAYHLLENEDCYGCSR
jgi:hypothetical protein